MKIETIENIFNFLKEKEDKELPNKWVNSIKKLKLIQKLETHPDGIQYRYEGDLKLIGSNITKLPNDLYVDGYLMLSYCKQLTKLSDNLHIEGNLGLNDTNIIEIPNNLYVGGALYLWNTPIAKNYTYEEIIETITSKGGRIEGQIIT